MENKNQPNTEREIKLAQGYMLVGGALVGIVIIVTYLAAL